MKGMSKRICALLLASVLSAGVLPACRAEDTQKADETQKAEDTQKTDDTQKSEDTPKTEDTQKAEEPEGRVLIDWNCDTLEEEFISLGANTYPHYYFADSSMKGVEPGTVYMAGNARASGYATMTLQSEMTTAAVTLEMDMKVDSLVTPASNPNTRGFVIEFTLPNSKLLYIALRDMDGTTDENGCNATLHVSSLDRASEYGYKERIAIPTDGKFHTWTFQYDGESLLRLSIDGETVQDFPEVNVFHSKGAGRLQLKNVMLNRTEDSALNVVTFDRIRVTEGTTLLRREIESAAVAPGAVAERFTVTARLNRLEENGTLTVSVYPRGKEERAVTASLMPEALSTDVTLENLPFTGLCTVLVQYADAQPFSFNYYLYHSYEKIAAGAEVKAKQADAAYVFTDLGAAEVPEDSTWYTLAWETATDSGSALCTPAVGTVQPLTVPVTLTGKYAVFAGYVEGSQAIGVNGTEVSFDAPGKIGTNICEAFVAAVDADGEKITLENVPHASAQIAYLKFLSISDELYDIATRKDDSHTFITDNDGYSTLTDKKHGDYETLFNSDFVKPYNSIDQRQFIWCTFSTSILNYDSEVWWEYVESRLRDLNIPEDKWPEDFLDHVDTEGNHPDYDGLMRQVDKNAYSNIRALNEEGYPHKVLSDMAAEKIEDSQFYVSLRMSHYNDGQYAFQTGALYHLHPEWIREGGVQASYAHEEYRNYLHDLLIEMAEPENVTGVLMDFGRYYYIFGDELTDVEKRTEIMNEFVKSVRDDLPKGKKLTVRVLDPIYEKATVWGLDYKTWVKEGWVDRVYISCQSHETFFDFDEYITFFEEYPETEFYLGVNATLSGTDTTKAEEEILQAGGTVQQRKRVDEMDIMLRISDFYAAGADGVFTFNWSGTASMFQNVQNATRMLKWYYFTYPTTLSQPQKAMFTDKGGQRVIFDYDCTSLSVPFVSLGDNAYPNYYFADHRMDETVPEGVIYLGGTAAEKTGYATLTLPLTGAGKAYTVTMDLKIDSIMQPSASPAWRGLIFEISNPGAPLLYFTLNGMETDGDGNNAVLYLSKKNRAGTDVEKKIALPDDDEFHTWTVDFDGKGGVVISIDGKELVKADGITVQPKQDKPILQIKNMMMDIAAGQNSLFIDSVTVTSQVEAHTTAPLIQETNAEKIAARATVERRAEVLGFPVKNSDFEKACTVENAADPGKYTSHGKEAEVQFAYDKTAKQLTLYVTYPAPVLLRILSLCSWWRCRHPCRIP